jgi:hypothetical protein
MDKNMTEEEIARRTLDAIGALLNGLPNAEARRNALELLMMTSYNFMRQFGGDEYVRGWLESALKEVTTTPPFVGFRAPH